jgi:uncharacterized repeat protein (TIGR01451 family)
LLHDTYDGGDGLYGSGTTIIGQSCIVGTGDTSIKYYSQDGTTLTAVDNWWGTANGPGGAGNGGGDSIIAGVFISQVTFAPFLAAPILDCPSLSGDLAITNTVAIAGEPALPGQFITFTLTFVNHGPDIVRHVLITDPVPTALSDISVMSSTFGEIIDMSASPTFVWSVSDLPREAGVIVLSAQISPTLSADMQLANPAAIGATTPDLDPSNNQSSSEPVTVRAPRVAFSASAYRVDEDTGSALVTVTLDSPNPYAAVTVDYATLDGSALAPEDYTAVNATLAITPGFTNATLAISIVDAAVLEADEFFTVALSNSSGAVLGDNTTAQVAIGDDDSELFIAPLEADKAEGDSGATDFTFVVTRTGYLTGSVSVDWSVSGSVAGDDFVEGVLPGGSLSFNPGEASQLRIVTVQGDFIVEADEPFTVLLSNPSVNASISTASAGGVIRNDDEAAELTVSKQANVSLARVGEPITYTVRITNSGLHTLTQIVAVDDMLGAVTLGQSSLEPGEATSGQLTYTVQQSDLPGPLENTVTVTGTPIAGAPVVVSAQATVTIEPAGPTQLFLPAIHQE